MKSINPLENEDNVGNENTMKIQDKAVEKGIEYLEETEVIHPRLFIEGVLNPKVIIALQITAKAKEEEMNGTLIKKARVIYGDLVSENIQLQKQIEIRDKGFKEYQEEIWDLKLKIKQFQKENEELKEHINNDIQCIRCSTVKALRITIENLKQEHGLKDK